MKSFEGQVADWVASKPAGEVYVYESPEDCALCQFLRDMGYAKAPRVVPQEWRDRQLSEVRHKFSWRLESALNCEPYTFGALADRLRA